MSAVPSSVPGGSPSPSPLFDPSMIGRTGTTRYGERVVVHGPALDPARCTVYPVDAAVRGMESFTPRVCHVVLDEIEDTSEDPASEHGFDVCPSCGDTGVRIDASGYVSCARFLTCWTDVVEGDR